MKIKFLGTAAAESWPGVFCACEACEKARKLGGRNIRARAQCMIDDEFLIDMGPDTYSNTLRHQVDMQKIQHVLVTHSHSDHLEPNILFTLFTRSLPFTTTDFDFPLMIHGNQAVGKVICQDCGMEEWFDKVIAFSEIKAFEWYEQLGLSFMPLPATHKPDEDAFIFVIKRNGKTILYGNDTGLFKKETWAKLAEQKFDLVLMDCTFGVTESGGENSSHMGYADNVEVKNKLLALRCCDENTIFISTHFSHNGKAVYDELVPIAEKDGILVAYDGMVIEL